MGKKLFKPGESGNPAGRPRGKPNKFSQIKQKFLQVFEEIGGADKLAEWVMADERNLETFYRLIVQLMPRETKLDATITASLADVLNGIAERRNDDPALEAEPDSVH